MSREIHYKCTTWNKIVIYDDNISNEEIIEHLKKYQDPLETGFDLCQNSEWENISDTEELLTVEENEGFSTIEFQDEKGKQLYENSNLSIMNTKKYSIDELNQIWKECYGEELKENYKGFIKKLKEI